MMARGKGQSRDEARPLSPVEGPRSLPCPSFGEIRLLSQKRSTEQKDAPQARACCWGDFLGSPNIFDPIRDRPCSSPPIFW